MPLQARPRRNTLNFTRFRRAPRDARVAGRRTLGRVLMRAVVRRFASLLVAPSGSPPPARRVRPGAAASSSPRAPTISAPTTTSAQDVDLDACQAACRDDAAVPGLHLQHRGALVLPEERRRRAARRRGRHLRPRSSRGRRGAARRRGGAHRELGFLPQTYVDEARRFVGQSAAKRRPSTAASTRRSPPPTPPRRQRRLPRARSSSTAPRSHSRRSASTSGPTSPTPRSAPRATTGRCSSASPRTAPPAPINAYLRAVTARSAPMRWS